MVDYIIVGSGIAGICLAEIALQNNKTILVFDNDSQNSSKIAAGIYNPVILKRFSEVWDASNQIDFLSCFYPQIESRLQAQVDFKMPVIRKFFSTEEQNNWFVAADKPSLARFLSLHILTKQYVGIDSPYSFGQVLHTGYVDTRLMLHLYQEYLIQNELLIKCAFSYSDLQFHNYFVQYGNFKAKHIIFAEGFGFHANPFFNYLPLDGTKGELLIIKAPELNLDCILNSSVYILPLGNDLFKVGATYNWSDKTNNITTEGKQELIDKIDALVNCEYEIIDHLAGIRPTVKDRRPLVGTHSEYNNVHILNGLGTRGVMLGPVLAYSLFQNIENQIPLNPYCNINRFD